MTLPTVRLLPARDKRVLGGHPWVYSNEIAMDQAAKALAPGAIVDFRAADGSFIGRGGFNARSLIAGRIFTRKAAEAIDGGFIRARIADALALREQLFGENFYRLVHAEADGLPGLIIDRFGPYLAVQANTAAMDALTPLIEEALVDLLKPACIALRNDSAMRETEGLARESRLLRGTLDGNPVEVHENGLVYFADLQGGQKTGWYFDQRGNRALVARYVAGAEKVLDLYCHAGGFGLLAAKSGARRVTFVDSSEAALALAQKAALHNDLAAQCEFHRADVFLDLEKRRDKGEKYEAVIADPPAFAKSRKDVGAGARAYRKLAKLSANLVAPRGMLFIASCSHNMELANFTEQVARGLFDAKREGRILHTVFASPDHPVHPHLPESAYLKGLLLRLD